MEKSAAGCLEGKTPVNGLTQDFSGDRKMHLTENARQQNDAKLKKWSYVDDTTSKYEDKKDPMTPKRHHCVVLQMCYMQCGPKNLVHFCTPYNFTKY